MKSIRYTALLISCLTFFSSSISGAEESVTQKDINDPPFLPIDDILEDFPLLPTENREVSRSVGTVTDGYIWHTHDLKDNITGVRFFENQEERELHYTGDAMYNLIRDSVAKLQQKKFPTPLFLGNFSAKFGGDIPYSVSHNSGRDGDIAFFVVDAEGDPIDSPGIVPFDAAGTYRDEKGQYYQFDTVRNWDLVEALIETSEAGVKAAPATHARIQYLFISNPLREMLLDNAVQRHRPKSTIAKAAILLRQPGGHTLPHNDHIHIRIHCSDNDIVSGCVETGPVIESRRAQIGRLRHGVIADAKRTFKSKASDAATRRAALERLLLLDPNNGTFATTFADADPLVRGIAVRSPTFAAKLDIAFKSLKKEHNPWIYAEMLQSIFTSNDSRAEGMLFSQLYDPRVVPIGTDGTVAAPGPADGRIDLRNAIVRWLGRRESKSPTKRLIMRVGALTAEENQSGSYNAVLATTILDALKYLTNQRPPSSYGVDEQAHWWQMWWKENGGKSREQWLLEGFAQSNYPVESVTTASSVWVLIDALKDSHEYLSWNAHRLLRRLEDPKAPTMEWSNHDAQYHWRRWFQKRTRRRDVPPVPERFDVDLHPYVKEEDAVQ